MHISRRLTHDDNISTSNATTMTHRSSGIIPGKRSMQQLQQKAVANTYHGNAVVHPTRLATPPGHQANTSPKRNLVYLNYTGTTGIIATYHSYSYGDSYDMDINIPPAVPQQSSLSLGAGCTLLRPAVRTSTISYAVCAVRCQLPRKTKRISHHLYFVCTRYTEKLN